MGSSRTVEAHQRRRILSAATDVFGRQGFDQTPIEDVIAPAGVSRRTFYDLFSGKDQVFCAAHGDALDLLDDEVTRACGETEGWPNEVAAGVGAALAWAAAEPTMASLLVGSLSKAGPRAAYCHDLLVARFAPRLRRGRALAEVTLPPTQEEMLIAGVAGVVAMHVDASEEEALAPLAPQLVELLLTPYLGNVRARRVAAEERANA